MTRIQKQERPWVARLLEPLAHLRRTPRSTHTGNATVERINQLTRAILSDRGEVSAASIAQEFVGAFCGLSVTERANYYRQLTASFRPDAVRLTEAAEGYLRNHTLESEMLLAKAAEPPRQEVLRRINMAHGGTALLVAIRRELRSLLTDDPSFRALDSDLYHLFTSWFNRGFLQLRRIDWNTPAAILEKLIQHEAVHEIHGWDDLHRRLGRNRRCFAFFHPALPDDPIIFVEIALTHGPARSVRALLRAQADPAEPSEGARNADTATFYSISNCQPGLYRVSFGNLLIKQVVQELQAECPYLRRFATLSPVPGFRAWLISSLNRDGAIAARLSAAAYSRLATTGVCASDRAAHEAHKYISTIALATLLSDSSWVSRARIRSALRPVLLQLAAVYLTKSDELHVRMDPVARFHLRNGAVLNRINWMADASSNGIASSLGIMVNYIYEPGAIDANHELFAREHRIAQSREVSSLASAMLTQSLSELSGKSTGK